MSPSYFCDSQSIYALQNWNTEGCSLPSAKHTKYHWHRNLEICQKLFASHPGQNTFSGTWKKEAILEKLQDEIRRDELEVLSANSTFRGNYHPQKCHIRIQCRPDNTKEKRMKDLRTEYSRYLQVNYVHCVSASFQQREEIVTTDHLLISHHFLIHIISECQLHINPCWLHNRILQKVARIGLKMAVIYGKSLLWYPI